MTSWNSSESSKSPESLDDNQNDIKPPPIKEPPSKVQLPPLSSIAGSRGLPYPVSPAYHPNYHHQMMLSPTPYPMYAVPSPGFYPGFMPFSPAIPSLSPQLSMFQGNGTTNRPAPPQQQQQPPPSNVHTQRPFSIERSLQSQALSTQLMNNSYNHPTYHPPPIVDNRAAEPSSSPPILSQNTTDTTPAQTNIPLASDLIRMKRENPDEFARLMKMISDQQEEMPRVTKATTTDPPNTEQSYQFIRFKRPPSSPTDSSLNKKRLQLRPNHPLRISVEPPQPQIARVIRQDEEDVVMKEDVPPPPANPIVAAAATAYVPLRRFGSYTIDHADIVHYLSSLRLDVDMTFLSEHDARFHAWAYCQFTLKKCYEVTTYGNLAAYRCHQRNCAFRVNLQQTKPTEGYFLDVWRVVEIVPHSEHCTAGQDPSLAQASRLFSRRTHKYICRFIPTLTLKKLKSDTCGKVLTMAYGERCSEDTKSKTWSLTVDEFDLLPFNMPSLCLYFKALDNDNECVMTHRMESGNPT